MPRISIRADSTAIITLSSPVTYSQMSQAMTQFQDDIRITSWAQDRLTDEYIVRSWFGVQVPPLAQDPVSYVRLMRIEIAQLVAELDEAMVTVRAEPRKFAKRTYHLV